MKLLRTLALIALACGVTATAGADTIRMDSIAIPADGSRPARGMSQASVQAKFGAPSSTRAAVGQPPITRWDYSGFVVYFEYDKVIHSVAKR